MSGFEIIGVVLGTLPLLISGLEHYKNGLVPIQDMLSYENVVQNHIRGLNVARSRLRHSCERLLNGLVDDEKITSLLDHTSLVAWKESDLDRKLRERLDQSYEGYMATLADLAQKITIFAKKMGLDSKFRPSWIAKPNKKRRAIFGDDLKKKSARLWKIVKVGLDHNEFDTLIKEMAHENLQLEALTQGNLELEPIRRERSRNIDAGYWKSVRQFALRLYNCLMSNWPCQCRISHKASLRLDIRTTSREEKMIDVTFAVVFVFCNNGTLGPWQWRQTEIKSIESSNSDETSSLSPTQPMAGRRVAFVNIPSPPISPTPSPDPSSFPSFNTAKIDNLCLVLAQEAAGSCCLGYLGDDHSQHYIYPAAQQTATLSPHAAISLHQILAAEARCQPVAIKPRDRLELAFLLSSSILQLYNTPWLSDNWSRKEIYLLAGNSGQATTLAHNFYVSKGFAAPEVTTPADFDPELALLRNISVVNLGLALIELTFGHPIEYYETEHDLRNGARTILTNRLIAERLIGQIEEIEEMVRFGMRPIARRHSSSTPTAELSLKPTEQGEQVPNLLELVNSRTEFLRVLPPIETSDVEKMTAMPRRRNSFDSSQYKRPSM
ncbi:hypothetical protein B0J14DRAFT_558719 [Halenospora varia]|nr:hypothetical protein B0J14DRAFT_558719 [Halenospora varia]